MADTVTSTKNKFRISFISILPTDKYICISCYL
nr:MAG TPA: hypothetical protein [Caudoviricetes sp.]